MFSLFDRKHPLTFLKVSSLGMITVQQDERSFDRSVHRRKQVLFAGEPKLYAKGATNSINQPEGGSRSWFFKPQNAAYPCPPAGQDAEGTADSASPKVGVKAVLFEPKNAASPCPPTQAGRPTQSDLSFSQWQHASFSLSFCLIF